jgi:hypothetical protein
MHATTLKHFDQPDEVRTFPHGRFEIVHLAGASLGRATYQPGWKWSEHNSPLVGTALCHAPHTGVVISGHAASPEPAEGTSVDRKSLSVLS